MSIEVQFCLTTYNGLLKMFAEKFSEQAKELVGTTVYGFEHYDTNVLEFRKKGEGSWKC